MMLEVNNLCIDFINGRKLSRVVNNFALSMSSGEIVGIVGESGSGKTATALAISGLLNRSITHVSGEIIFEGSNLPSLSRREMRRLQGSDIGVIFQEPMTSLNPLMKVGPQVEESIRVHTSLNKAQRKERAIQALKSAELSSPETVYDLYPHQLSGGMRQRAMIAAAVITRPKLLIADEPTTALDVTIQAQIITLLRKISREQNVGILFISHDLSIIRRLCTRVLVMKNGEVVEQGDTTALFTSPKEDYTRRLIDCIPTRSRKNE